MINVLDIPHNTNIMDVVRFTSISPFLGATGAPALFVYKETCSCGPEGKNNQVGGLQC